MKKTLIFISLLFSLTVNSQNQKVKTNNPVNLDLKFNYEDENKFGKYVRASHTTIIDFDSWKKENKILYINELWYYSHSFYIKRNYMSDGDVIDESMIDISRFESARHETDEVIIPAIGFKDAIVLLPKNKLKYNPYN